MKFKSNFQQVKLATKEPNHCITHFAKSPSIGTAALHAVTDSNLITNSFKNSGNRIGCRINEANMAENSAVRYNERNLNEIY